MRINLIQSFEKTSLNNPLKIAVVEGDQTINFQTLRSKSLILSEILNSSLSCSNQPIACYLPKSISNVIANLAITYSGNIYMNLDIKTPDLRINNIVNVIEPVCIITNSQYFEKLNRFSDSIRVINLDDLDLDKMPDHISIGDPLAKISHLIDTDPYCIINTSGSTGTPKGVVLNHKSFIDFMDWTLDTFKFSCEEVIGSLSPVVFDIYSFELCMMMVKSSTLVLIPDTLAAFPVKILELLEKHKISFIFWVPTIMVNIANMDLLSHVALPNLKTVWFAGEVFPTKQFNYWKKKLNAAVFVNLYGPIEITLDCTYFIVNREVPDDEPLPIGFPCRNTDILILNSENKLAQNGEDGELCVRGTSLAMGYYNNPEKTALAFVQNPINTKYPELIYRTGDIVSRNNNNEIVFKGRVDSLVKHLGYRVELAEIEHVIVNVLKLVKNGCIVYNFTKKEIVLFYEAAEEIGSAEFRKNIGSALPKYMIPVVYFKMDELPRNTNGKIDRLQLKEKVNS